MLCAVVGVALAPAASAAPAAGARTGLPPGVAPAALRPEAALPAPAAWPFTEAFPRTSGTGRYDGGALLWTDFLYDDNGAASGLAVGESAGAPTFGTYTYPDERHAGNGADIFRAGIGLADDTTWWRVDWNTLVDRNVPAAAFGIDRDARGGPATAWGGNTGLTSSGVDATLVITAKGAFLDGKRVADTAVDMAARSFVAGVPADVLDLGSSSRLFLAAGLADDAGTQLLSLGPEHGHVEGQANVYNVAFRDYADEPPEKNFWFDTTQAFTLAFPGADVSAFALVVDWWRLRERQTEPARFVRGWSNAWYVSAIELGQGRVTGVEGNADNEPDYLGRVQPYGVYVPHDYHPGTPAPLTWLLHSLTINHNQYSATAPQLIELACEQRGSLCATTLGRGPDGYYRGPAELDFWEVWRALAGRFTLDRDRTTVGGFSMGGFGTFNFALDHPDVFAGAFILAAAANEDLPRLRNARWLPYYHAHGTQDQLVPYATEARPTVAELDRLGYRYRFDTYPTKDHIAWSLEDGLELAGAWLGEQDRVRVIDPGRITYRWFPAEVDRRLGIGPRGAWWVRRVRARDVTAGEATVAARSLAKPARAVELQRSTSQLVDPNGSPVEREELTWRLGERPAPRPRLKLRLDNVGSVSVNLRRAGLAARPGSVVVVRTDGPVVLSLRGVAEAVRPKLDGRARTTVMRVPAGRHKVTFAWRTP